MANVLITGAAGFVGAHTARHFLQQGWEVCGYDLRAANPVAGMTAIEGDILDRGCLERTITAHKITGIVHTAGLIREPACQADPESAFRINVQGTSTVLEVARAHGLRLTFISTATLYGRDPSLRPCHEDDPVDPVGLYDATKHMAETLCLSYHKVYDLDITAVRTSFVYGPGHGIGLYFVDQARTGQIIKEADGADHPCEYTYIKDLARGIFLAHTTRPLQHRLFNIASGVQRPRHDLIDLVKKTYPQARIEVGPGISPTGNLRGPCHLDRARTELGFEPAYTLETGLADWLRQYT